MIWEHYQKLKTETFRTSKPHLDENLNLDDFILHFYAFSAIELTYRGFKVFNWDKDCENPNA